MEKHCSDMREDYDKLSKAQNPDNTTFSACCQSFFPHNQMDQPSLRLRIGA